MTDDNAIIQPNKEKGWFRTAISVFALIALIGITAVYLVFVARNSLHPPRSMEEVFENHGAAALGLPLAAHVGQCAVLTLEAKSGPIEFGGPDSNFMAARTGPSSHLPRFPESRHRDRAGLSLKALHALRTNYPNGVSQQFKPPE